MNVGVAGVVVIYVGDSVGVTGGDVAVLLVVFSLLLTSRGY